jgi:two-component SAPR family response regulator/Flp pilus assembly protein TadD
METVQWSNLFVQPVGEEGTWLRYHHLFRDFLQARLIEEQPDEEKHILRRLATVYIKRNQWENAHALYQRLGDISSTADLIETAGPSLVKGGQLSTLADWLDGLPSATLNSRPSLLSLQGVVATNLGEVERGLFLQNRAEATFREMNDEPRLAQALLERAVANRFLGNYQASEADADEAMVIAIGNESLRNVHAEALRAKGMSLYQLGHLNDAIDWLKESLAAYDRLDDTHRVAMLLMELGTAYERAGHYDLALDHHERALSYWRRMDNVVQQANLLNNLGVVYHLRGDYEGASSLLEEALTCARQSGYTRLEGFTLASIGDLYVDLEAPDEASIAYSQAHEIAQRIDERFLILYLDLAEAALARSHGEMDQARDLLEAAGHLAQQSSSDFEIGLHQFEAGRLALAEGDTMGSVAYLEGAARRFDSGGQQVEGAQAHFYLALAYLAAQDERATTDHLLRAFEIASNLESQHTLVVAGREAKTLLGAAKKDKTVARQASQLLRQVIEFEQDISDLRRRLRRQASAIPFASPKLSIQTLGRAEVTIDGKPVTSADWQGQVARDLFFYLLAHPDGLTKESVGRVFWPESSPGQLKLRFKNALYRLRQALGQESVLFEEDRYRFNRTLDYVYDVEVFLGKLAQARAAPDADAQASAYQSAVPLYQGPYLPEVEGEWAWWERERLSQNFLESILKLAEFHLEAEEYDQALGYCRRALDEDRCLEEAHRLAMRAHAGLGNRAAVVRQYERCQQALLNEVDISPSPQTTALYKTLTR